MLVPHEDDEHLNVVENFLATIGELRALTLPTTPPQKPTTTDGGAPWAASLG